MINHTNLSGLTSFNENYLKTTYLDQIPPQKAFQTPILSQAGLINSYFQKNIIDLTGSNCPLISTNRKIQERPLRKQIVPRQRFKNDCFSEQELKVLKPYICKLLTFEIMDGSLQFELNKHSVLKNKNIVLRIDDVQKLLSFFDLPKYNERKYILERVKALLICVYKDNSTDFDIFEKNVRIFESEEDVRAFRNSLKIPEFCLSFNDLLSLKVLLNLPTWIDQNTLICDLKTEIPEFSNDRVSKELPKVLDHCDNFTKKINYPFFKEPLKSTLTKQEMMNLAPCIKKLITAFKTNDEIAAYLNEYHPTFDNKLAITARYVYTICKNLDLPQEHYTRANYLQRCGKLIELILNEQDDFRYDDMSIMLFLEDNFDTKESIKKLREYLGIPDYVKRVDFSKNYKEIIKLPNWIDRDVFFGYFEKN